jgi:carbamoyl-phosphate synthase large subunit
MTGEGSFAPTVAVTGLNATDNPGPGVGVIRCLRADPDFRGRVVGLAYDSLDPGIYAPDVADRVYLMPYPSEGHRAVWDRLAGVIDDARIDVVIPTLDAELPAFIELEKDLAHRGVHTFLPTREQFDLRSKTRLEDLGARCGVPVPRTRLATQPRELFQAAEELGLPIVVKGLFYGAMVCHSLDEAVASLHKTAAQWGLPVVVQQYVPGEEYDVSALGDGHGGMVGAVPMKKLFLTDKGKGWAGVTVGEPALLDVTERVLRGLRWRGPCEVEVVHSKKDGRFYLLEINPRFPAWIYLSAGAGQNLPAACARLALGEEIDHLPPCRVGTMFVRISLDQIASFRDFEDIMAHGRIVRDEGES